MLDHLSKPPIASGELEPWATQIRALAAHENVACKLSGMVTEADWAAWSVDDLRPYAEVVLDAFGPERVLFGSDWPVCLLAASYEAGRGRRGAADGAAQRRRARADLRRHRPADLYAAVTRYERHRAGHRGHQGDDHPR